MSMIEAQSDFSLCLWFNTNVPSNKQSPEIEFIDANKLGRIFGSLFPGKAQFQRTLIQTKLGYDNSVRFHRYQSNHDQFQTRQNSEVCEQDEPCQEKDIQGS